MSKPKIRFKEYTDDWEQCKVGAAAEYRRGSFPQPYGNKDWYDGEGAMPFVQVADVTDEMNLAADTKQKISKLAQPMSVYAAKNSVLVTLQGSIGRVAITQYGAFVDRTILIFEKYKKEIDYIFWAYIIKKKFIEEARKAPGGTVKTITKEALSDFGFMLPDYKEQMKIGQYLQILDHLITLHQCKCEETKKLKKYMLQKMFPKNGTNVPEIRIDGFTDAWEQRKLGDIAERVTRKNRNLVSELPLTISAQYGLIDQNEFFDKRVASKDVSGYYLIYNGEFAYNKSTSNDAPWGAIKRLDSYENGVLSTLYIVFKIKDENTTSSDFIAAYYDTSNWHKDIQAIAAEGARNHGLLNIAPADFFKTMLLLPQDIEEQQKIGDYFKSLDTLITLHQRKLEKLQKIKKSMLEKMFV